MKETYIGRKLTGNDPRFIYKGKFNDRTFKTAKIINDHGQQGDILVAGITNTFGY